MSSPVDTADSLPSISPRRTVRQRLVWGSIAVGTLALLSGVLTLWQVERLGGAVRDLQVATARMTAALQIHQDSTELIAMVSRLLPVEDAAVFETQVAAALESLRDSHAALTALAEDAASGEPASALMRRVDGRIDNVVGVAETMVRQASAGQWPSVRVRVGVLIRDHRQLELETNELVELTTEMEAAAAARVTSARRAAVLYPVVGVCLVALLAVPLIWETTRSIAGPVEQLTEGALHLATGAWDRRVVIESADEFGQLAVAFNWMADRLEASHIELEQRVAERTADLHRRAVQLQAAAEVARDATAMRELDDLLNEVVLLIQERFGFYYAGIFLIDGAREYAVLQAASGEAGHRMLDAGHKLAVEGDGIVVHVIRTGQSCIALDVGTDAIHFANPLLPETRSEIALPLKVGGQVIGALDVQSQQAAAFDEDDVIVLQTMADQLAMAIENAGLLEQMQLTLYELAQERNLLGATLNALPDLLFEVDRDGRIFDFRAPDPALLLVPPSEFLGQRLDRVLPEEPTHIIMAALQQAAETGWHAGAVYPLGMSGGMSWFELSIAVKGDPAQPDARFIALARDVTARVQAEEKLRQYMAELEARNEELDAFAHTVAHDLKNPLAIMIGNARVLQEEAGLTPQEVAACVRAVLEGGYKMGTIIDSLLLLASVRKSIEVELRPLNMARVVDEALRQLSYLIQGCGAKILLPARWPRAVGYAPWVEAVWVNYLHNALKYGGSPPHVELAADPPVEGMVRFSVRDDGLGLTEEEQARLFVPLTRIDQVRGRGHGLGLSIVRRIVTRLGGNVGIESEVGSGSLFWFTLPADQ